MSTGRLARLEALFLECVELPAEARAARLERSCPDDPDLRREVLELLARDDATPAGLGEPSGGAPLPLIGSYRLGEKLGEGGFGEVFAAEQTSPIRRRVAIKVLKAGMDTKAVLARFEAERQTLALMDHSGIARVLDAGETKEGRPYFVMELVAGRPITEFADEAHLSTRERLDLFIAVCRAVEHAHQKGVIHRDLKPSNILVTAVEGIPAPRIIDFGIAKATHAERRQESLRTRAGEFLGTPEYASPEQAESDGIDIDTRADVYSLGVVLYRLLTGRLPFEATKLRSGGVAEVRRALREHEPPRPSQVAETPPLGRELRGDLDWIILRALEKDRVRRYPSASALAEDIERYLRNDAVLAGPPTAWYRLRKFVRRRRALVASAAAVLVALLGGITATTLQAVRASRAEQEALRQARITTEVNAFLTRMLESANPESNPHGSEVTVREALDLAASDLASATFDDPTIEAGVRQALGSTYAGLALYAEAAAQLERTVAIERASLGVEAPATLTSLLSLAEALENQGRTTSADSLLAEVGLVIGDPRAAIRPRGAGAPGYAPALVARYLEVRGDHVANASRLNEADSLLSAAIDIRRAESSAPPAPLARTLVELAQIRGARGRLDEAEALGREALRITRAAHPGDHHEVAMGAARLASILEDCGKLEEAEQLLREAVDIHRRVLGPRHPIAAISLGNLALVLDKEGRHAEAEASYREALAVARPALGEENREVATMEDNLAVALQAQGKYDEALPLRLRVLAVQRRDLGENHAQVASTLNNLGALYRLMHRYADAESTFRRANDIFIRVYGVTHPNVAIGKHNLAKTLLDEGRCQDALAPAREAVEIAEQVFPPGQVNRFILAATYGRALACLGRREEAERVLLDAHSGIVAALGSDHARAREVAGNLASLYDASGRSAEARRWRTAVTPAPHTAR